MQAFQQTSRHTAATQPTLLLSIPQVLPRIPVWQCTTPSGCSPFQPIIPSRTHQCLASPVPTHAKDTRTSFQIFRKSFLSTVISRRSGYRTLSTTTLTRASPPPPVHHVTVPSPLTLDQYHALSDAFIDNLVAQLEEMQEERDEVDVEYSAGVLTLIFPPQGTYVLNKQPPNKQIWLSSPVSGPKRFDWVENGGQEGQKGSWTYLRDGSTLDALLEEEVGVSMGDV